MKKFAIAVFLIAAFGAAAQKPATSAATGPASSSGACSIAHSGNNDTIIIKNCGIGTEQAQKIIALLKEVAKNKDIFQMNAKLDELLKVATRPTQIVSAPNGIGAIDSTLVNPTVNNFATPARHIPESIKPDLISCLSKKPGTVSIMAPLNDAEAGGLANEWMDVFDKAKWSIDEKRVKIYMAGGVIQTGTSINISGTIDSDGKNAKFDPDSPSGVVVACYLGKPSDGSTNLSPSSSVAKDHVGIVVGPRPPS